jgi:hypothetical protein
VRDAGADRRAAAEVARRLDMTIPEDELLGGAVEKLIREARVAYLVARIDDLIKSKGTQ